MVNKCKTIENRLENYIFKITCLDELLAYVFFVNGMENPFIFIQNLYIYQIL